MRSDARATSGIVVPLRFDPSVGTTASRLVIDASVWIDAMVVSGDVGDRARRSIRRHRWCGPEHLRVEAISTVRGWVLGRKISAETGLRAVRGIAAAHIQTVPTMLLFERIWELRDNLTAYDAAYVAAAEYVKAPLVTSDKRLAAAPGVRCEVRLPG